MLRCSAAAENLKYLCRLGAGMDNVDFEAAKKLNITVENTPSAHVDGVAELTLGGILSCHEKYCQCPHKHYEWYLGKANGYASKRENGWYYWFG